MYSIYKITSPSGKYYIGLTKNPIKERWRQHVKRAFTESRNHPFYNAIRKYGPDKFTVEKIDTAIDKPEAQKKERQWIAKSPKDKLYNLSPGGEADGETGSKIFWDSIRKDPDRLKEYLSELSETKRKNDWSDYDMLSEKSAEWRRTHPREAFKIQYRASRVARRKHLQSNGSPSQKNEMPLKERLRRKYKPFDVKSEIARKEWETRSADEREEICHKISEKAIQRWDKITDPDKRSEMTQAARNSIDRKKQGAAASAGIKRFWDELRADPEKYKEYMDRRTASLNETLRKKKNI